ncbi:RNA-binding protein (Nab3), putative [Paecilomyces variotii No. 5]|uniref:RNA-binding protein (Nab3), putative n=1 Tax=Byssochlamys spectabilis (strain No. 5 / NBRC 109023) TaxID=1356009 RepID=V5FXA1_BYSSN|nr:RNA-binding protein (Nab3), putative [Paecilomyces variotii No. 5]
MPNGLARVMSRENAPSFQGPSGRHPSTLCSSLLSLFLILSLHLLRPSVSGGPDQTLSYPSLDLCPSHNIIHLLLLPPLVLPATLSCHPPPSLLPLFSYSSPQSTPAPVPHLSSSHRSKIPIPRPPAFCVVDACHYPPSVAYMTSSPPDEAIHFRGKTLTPESPRPLHIPEPANIPVLQNMMDPVFNDTSTYEKSHFPQESTATYNENPAQGPWSGYMNGGNTQGAGSAQGQETGSFHFDSQQVDGSMSRNETNLSTDKDAHLSHHSSPAMAETSTTRPNPANPNLTAVPSDPTALLEKAISEGSSQHPPVPDSAPSIPQDKPIATVVDPTGSGSQPPPLSQDGLETKQRKDIAIHAIEDGVDFQNLLDNLSPSASTAPAGPTVTATVSSPAGDPTLSQTATDRSFPTPLGLPPRPPPQEKPFIHPNYTPTDDIRSYHQFPPQASSASAAYGAQQSSYPASGPSSAVAAPGAPGTSSGASDLPPPPVATFQQSQSATVSPQQSPPSNQSSQKGIRVDRHTGKPQPEDEAPWGPEVQKKYDEFLHDERVYVTEGLWDRFPPGSRLFVGNLPTERVTKRDLFHLFHKYGKLAQISIKQAYGFIQFLDAGACYQALQAEQGGIIWRYQSPREIPGRARLPQRPPAPLHRGAHDHQTLAAVDHRVVVREIAMTELMTLEECHSVTLGMSIVLEDAMTIARRAHRLRALIAAEKDTDPVIGPPTDLPIPRRAPRDVPDVQILVLDDVDRNFIFRIEGAFQSRGLRVDVMAPSSRISVSAIVHRQMVEGVLAVVKVTRNHQYSAKIPLQVFDRTGGPGNVRFNEYTDLDLSVAAEVVVRAQTMQRGGVPNPTAPVPYPPNPAFAAAPFPALQAQQAALPTVSNPGNIASLISTLDGPALQSLLGALQQQQRQPALPTVVPTVPPPFPTAPTANPADLASLLNQATRQQNPVPALQVPPGQPYGLPVQNPPVVPDPNLMSLLAKGLGGQQPQPQPQPQNPATIAPQVQNIVNQLTKWKQ